MNKKLLAGLVAGAMIVGLTGCGSNAGNDTVNNTNVVENGDENNAEMPEIELPIEDGEENEVEMPEIELPIEDGNENE